MIDKKLVDMSLGKIKADLVLKNGLIIDVFNQDIYKADVAVADGRIVGTGKYEGIENIDCSNKYICPAFIDSHVHIESSKVIPEVFGSEVLKKGVTVCIADPHEIANVLGEDGINFMINSARKSPIDIYFMIPSCVPAVESEDSGAVLKAENIEVFKNNPYVLGLGEVMDTYAVINYKDDMIKKLNIYKKIDGHCPLLDGKSLNAYILSGINTDHECLDENEAIEKIKKGMYVMIREGSAAKNLSGLIKAVNDKNFRRFLFCTDDKSIIDIKKEGSIDYNIKKAVKLGLDPVKALTIASLNAAECYGLTKKGAVAPGFDADIVILDDIYEVKINKVLRKGKLEYKTYSSEYKNFMPSMNIDYISPDIFKIPYDKKSIEVIKVLRGSIITQKTAGNVIIKDGYIEKAEGDDILKIAVFERHKKTGKYAVGFIEGLGLKNCSIAQSIAHDSHNIIAAGDNDYDMAMAVNRVIEMGGGIALVSNGTVIEEMGLPVGGLMTFESADRAVLKLEKLYNAAKKFLKYDYDVFLTLSFMALPVIPQLKITARGLYDYDKGEFINYNGI